MLRAPTLLHERAAWSGGRLLVGVDEAGRGPLAGPVVAAAVCFPPEAPRIRGIRDSKTLPAPRRATLAGFILDRAAAIGIAAASVREINRLNIRVATILAMRRALHRALGVPPAAGARMATGVHILVDGLLLPELGCPHDALVHGDARCYSIAAAGILAKTVRDRLMGRLAMRHPRYGWEANMGYGTAHHLAALGRHGPTRHHRLGFTPVAQLRLAL